MLKHLFDIAQKSLCEIYPDGEASQIAFMLLEGIYGASKTDVLLGKTPEKIVSGNDFNAALARLKNQEPIQYVLGYAYFCGHKFKVNSSTLIPRPETEELVDLVLSENSHKNPVNVLDIGTGSGCIPISLQLQRNLWKCTGADISKEALQIALQNSVDLGSTVDFIQMDILHSASNRSENEKKYDIIISNPPYVLNSDKNEMQSNVLDYEPHSALFVPDESPLIFYKSILEFCHWHLKPGGKVYFEIHQKMGKPMVDLMKKNNFTDAETRLDFNNKVRFAKGTYLPK